jgi:Tol biopolymer transport system component
LIGQRLGSYEITAKLGEGGMGVVYRATDSQLGRDVALKVLPAGFTEDEERLARFAREARVLASLNHPNIAHIYGFETSGATRALVMELVEGPTLAERLDSGPLPVHECLTVARQIAAALEEAHEKSIVHRDLKPQNVKVTDDDQVKVLDFGLAKAMEESGGTSTASQLAHSPTITFGATIEGVILGTAAYMAPEQAAGKAVDRRADIWAFGVVVYEMLTGRTLFAADSVPETLAGVLRGEIDLDALPAETPPAIRRLVRRCLERQPKARLRDIGDARIVLDDVLAGRLEEPAAAAPPTERTMARRRATWRAIAVALLAGVAATAVVDRTWLAPAPAAPPTIAPLTYSGSEFTPDVAPDGRSVVFASYRDGRSRIWLKQLATGEEVPLTEGEDLDPRVSPDGSSIVFSRTVGSRVDVYRVAIVGGDARRLVHDGLEPCWSPDGRSIAFIRRSARNDLDTLVEIPADGGEEQIVGRFGDRSLDGLNWSRDGRWIAARATGRQNFAGRPELVLIDASNGELRTVERFSGGTISGGLAWAGLHHLLFAMGASLAGKGPFRLLEVPFAGGASVPLVSLENLPTTISVAGPGRIVVDQPEARANLRLVDIGTPEGGEWVSRGASIDRQPTFSRDGRWIAFSSDRGGSLDIWELSLADRTIRRLTHDAADDWDPGYTPDGRGILWTSGRSGNFEIWGADIDGSGARQLSHDGVDAENPTMTADGRWIVYSSSRPGAGGIWKMHADGTGAERVVGGSFTIPEVSPDGRWIAAVNSDSLSQPQVELGIFALADGSRIATLRAPLGGLPVASSVFAPVTGRSRWMPDGRTLVFLGGVPGASGALGLFSQPIDSGRDTTAERRLLYRGDGDAEVESFGISPDGERLVVALYAQHSDLAMIEGLRGVDRK